MRGSTTTCRNGSRAPSTTAKRRCAGCRVWSPVSGTLTAGPSTTTCSGNTKIKGQTPAEMAGVSAPFTEWADVVRVAATDTSKRKRDTKTRTLSDEADRPGPDTAPPTTHFVPDPTRRRRPKGETDTDDADEEWPPSAATVARWRGNGTQMTRAPRSTRLGFNVTRPIPKGKASKRRASKNGQATAGRVASARPKNGKRR